MKQMPKKNGKPKASKESWENGVPPASEDRDHLGRFVQGHSGGPGRPPGTVNAMTVLKQKAKEAGTTVEAMAWDVLLAQQKAGSLAKRPDPAAARIFLDRACGPVAQKHEHRGDPEDPGMTDLERVTRIRQILAKAGLKVVEADEGEE